MRKWIEKWLRSRLMSANHQEELDTYRIASLLKFKERYDTVTDRKELETMKSLDLSYTQQRLYIASRFDRELENLFTIAYEKGGVDPYPAPVIEKLPEESDLSYEEIAERRLDVLSESDARKCEAEILERKLPHPDGFTTQIRYSSIDHPSAGFGVYVTEGNIIPGAIIGLYPGTIYTPDTFSMLNKDSEYMLTGYDGIVIDAHGWAESAIELRRKLRQYSNLSVKPPQLQRYRNPFAISNYINHPPKGEAPNVLGYAYSFSNKFPKNLTPFIPHNFKEKPKWYYAESVDLRTVVLVATRVIQTGEELFLDYRYNPAHPYPEWYHPVDEEAAKRRWAPTRIIY